MISIPFFFINILFLYRTVVPVNRRLKIRDRSIALLEETFTYVHRTLNANCVRDWGTLNTTIKSTKGENKIPNYPAQRI
ncbi:Uncharacterized protein APZ42_033860 [Daphnia magna]|uniref:Secreted protein n=1 Tax=Daphnia magna TaxID=35525 RepID=A0A164KNM0_9CRUS|nr:Uncharacterized protein APZ42_033860 [Daphnia magna]